MSERAPTWRSLSVVSLWLALAGGPVTADGFEWETVEPETVGLERAPLDRMAARIRERTDANVHSLLVTKGGKLAFEAYFEGQDQDWGRDLGIVAFDADTRHDLRSVSKSVTSALVGIAIAEGRLPDLETPVPDLFPDYADHIAPDKSAVTFEHILTMTAGLDWFEPPDYLNPGNDEIRMIYSPDPIAFVLGRSLAATPGEQFRYNGGLPTLLGYLLETAYGQRGRTILRDTLLAPLGIKGFDFRANDSGMLAYASGMRLTPRDMARIGLLYLNRGRWQGEQVLAEDWVDASLANHAKPDWTVGYGYQWWIMRFASDDRTIDVPAAVGNGGQHIFLLRELDMGVIITAGHYNRIDVPISGVDILVDAVLPAAGMTGMSFIRGD